MKLDICSHINVMISLHICDAVRVKACVFYFASLGPILELGAPIVCPYFAIAQYLLLYDHNSSVGEVAAEAG